MSGNLQKCGMMYICCSSANLACALLDCQLMRKEAGEIEYFEAHDGCGRHLKDMCVLAILSSLMLHDFPERALALH